MTDKDPLQTQVDRRRLFNIAGNIFKGVAAVAILGETACARAQDAAPASPSPTKIDQSGSAAPIDTLKIARLGIATPERVAGIDDESTLVEEFTLYDKYVNDTPDPAVTVIETCVYLRNGLSMSGTTPAEISSFGGNSAAYLAYIKRFNAPALKAMTGADQTATALEIRHNFVGAQAYAVQRYDSSQHYVATSTVDKASIRITKGSYAAGEFSAEFTVVVKDNLDSTEAHIENPDAASLNGKDIYVSTFTKVGDRWIDHSTGSYQADTGSK